MSDKNYKEKKIEEDGLYEWTEGNELSMDIVRKKYYMPEGESFDEWMERVSGGDSELESLLREKKFIFGGRILANRGVSNRGVSNSNCYVLSCHDSIEDIYDTCSKMARTYSYGGGVGVDISELRPRGAKVNNSANTTSGAVSFMKTFDNVTSTIGQCVSGTMMLMTERGAKRMKDIEVGDKVLTRKGFVEVVNKIDQGYRRCVRANSSMGYHVDCTSDHPFVTCDNENPFIEKKLCDYSDVDSVHIMEGMNRAGGYFELDYVSFYTKKGRVNFKGVLDESLAYAIGYFAGCGSFKKGFGRIYLNSSDIINRIKCELHNCVSNEDFSDVFEFFDNDGCCRVDIDDSFLEYLVANDISSERNGYMHVPELVFKSGFDVQMSYACGLFDSVGKCMSTKKFYRFVLQDKKLAEDVQLLLNMLCIVSFLECGRNGKYTVSVYGSRGVNMMSSMMNRSVLVSTSMFFLKKEVLETVYTRDSLVKYFGKCSSMVKKDGYADAGNAERVFNKYGVMDNNVYRSSLESVEDIGEIHVYDITLESENMFWCNGVYVHNCGRRGALMISMDVRHPDIFEFINIKANTTEITSANISVRVSDGFMNAVENDSDYVLRWPCDLSDYIAEYFCGEEFGKMYSGIHEGEYVYAKRIKARDLMMRLSENNWNYGEPGILFWDRICGWHLMSESKDFRYDGVNPCAEEPLPDGGACLLGSMNLYAYSGNGTFDWESFSKDVRTSVRALERVRKEGISKHPLDIQKDTCERFRQIGLGMFDLAGASVMNRLRYGSDEHIEFCNRIGRTMAVSAFEESCDMNFCKGFFGKKVEYPGMFDSRYYREMILPNIDKKYVGKYPLNSQILTIAPTGTISTMLNASGGGAEPMFDFSYTRTTKSLHGKDHSYNVYAKCVLDYFGGNMEDFDVSKLPDYFVKSDGIDWHDRIRVQAALQKWIDASISSTINLSESTTVSEVFDIYMEAWRMGLKGVTVFRRNCKRAAILNAGGENSVNGEFVQTMAPKRGKVLDADFYQVRANGDTFNIFVGLYDGKPYEMFAMPYGGEKIQNHKGRITKVSKKVYRFDSDILHVDNIALSSVEIHDVQGEIGKISDIVFEDSRLTKSDVESIRESVMNIRKWSENKDNEYRNVSLHVSGALRHGMPIKSIVSLEGKCNGNIVSFNAAVSRILNKYVPKEESGEICPECGGMLIRDGGCIVCKDCGWSKCG